MPSLPTRIWQSLRHLGYGTMAHHLSLETTAPERLRGALPDPWPGDTHLGNDFLGGELRLASHRVRMAHDPWSRDAEPPMEQRAAAALHGFSWLGAVRAVGTDAARRRAVELVQGWLTHNPRWSRLAWQPDILGERLANWLIAHAFLGIVDETHRSEFNREFLSSTARQARHLARTLSDAPTGHRALYAVRGLIFAGVCLPGLEKALAIGIERLQEELSRQILPDGGHIERNPSVLLDVLRIALDIRSALTIAQVEVPAALQGAIDRMAPMLRALRMGDGGLALFNGSMEEHAHTIDAVLAQSEVRGKALANAPHSGFQRLAAGRTVIIADCGPPPLKGFDTDAHAGTLSFEMSVGKHRLIVNCGTHHNPERAWRQASKSTAAHSTLTLDDVNSSELHDWGGIGSCPSTVENLRREADGDLWLETSHDGYANQFSYVHHRRWYLSNDGDDVRGEDTLVREGRSRRTPKSFTLRFHLHPMVHASLVQGNEGVLLKLPSGAGWRFDARGGTLSLEESIYMGTTEPPRRCDQIVIRGPMGAQAPVIKWRISPVAPPRPGATRAPQAG